MPQFECRYSSYKDPVKIAEDIRKQEDKWKENAGRHPYTSTLEDVVLIRTAQAGTPGDLFRVQISPERRPFGTKLSVHGEIVNRLRTWFPGAWPPGLQTKRFHHPVLFVGFDPHTLFKHLRADGTRMDTLPPPAMVDPECHVDISAYVAGELDWPTVVELRRPLIDPARYDEKMAGWLGPGHDVGRDINAVATFAVQLGWCPPLELNDGTGGPARTKDVAKV